MKIDKKYKYNKVFPYSRYILFRNGQIQCACDFDNHSECDYILPDENYDVILYSDTENKYVTVNLVKLLADVFIGKMDLPISFDKSLLGFTKLRYKLKDRHIKKISENKISICNIPFIEIKDAKGYYISEDGIIYDSKGKDFRLRHFTSKGYLAISKFCKELPDVVHRIVYKVYVGDLIDGLTINHIDTNKLNNHYSNLEQITNLANRRHAHLNNLAFKIRWFPDDIDTICAMMEKNICSSEIAEHFNLYTAREKAIFSTLCFDIREQNIWLDISAKYDLSKYDVHKWLTNEKLSDDDVREVRKLIKDGESLSSIAKRFNVSSSLISAIKSNRRRADVI